MNIFNQKTIFYHLLYSISLLLCVACSKDDNPSGNPQDSDISVISNLSESPSLLLGSWNLSVDNSTQNAEKKSTNCEATNIHFLENNTFYLKYLDKRIRGEYEITDSTSINLLSVSDLIGRVTQVNVNQNSISFVLEIIDSCNSNYTGEKYFRIHQFIWEALNEIYLWQEEVPALSDLVKPVGSARYKELVDPFPEPESFFNFLKHEDDRYSLIRSDYEVLENSIKGIDASNGVKFLLTRYGGGASVMGIVTYILEGSDAAEKDINRGDIFTGVDGQNLTVSNYSGLLFGENLDYTLNMADLNNNLLSPNGKNIALTKIENFQSNPIQLSKIIELGGTKVGYLMYNQFTQGFDDDLNEVFSNFKASGISELILDLRYNGGGLVSSALHLSGMISGQFNGEKFASFIYNQKVMNYYNSIEELKSRLNINFTNQLSDGSPINSLNLNKVYIITSERSASASELVINGLSPLMDVVQVGDNTYGKNVGGPAAVYDYIDNNGTKNPDHTYAMYPITFYIANGEDFYEYADGLSPQEDLKLKEDISNMGVLGENSDPLLALALNHISSISARYKFQIPVFPLENTLQDPKFIQQLLIPSIKELPPIQFD